MRLNQKTRGRRFNRARALHRKLGEIYNGNKDLNTKDVGKELAITQGLINRLIEYKQGLLEFHDDLLCIEKPQPKPEIRNFFDE